MQSKDQTQEIRGKHDEGMSGNNREYDWMANESQWTILRISRDRKRQKKSESKKNHRLL